MVSECPICYECYQSDAVVQPKILPCGHVFCLGCLREMTSLGKEGACDVIKCPLCRTAHDKPEAGVEVFPTRT